MRRARRSLVLSLPAVAAAVLSVLLSGLLGSGAAAGGAPAPLPPGSYASSHTGATHRAAASGSICYFGACYDYVAGRQYADASGASVRLWRSRPELDPADLDAHSLHELAVQSTDGSQIVEVGWTVDRGLNGDAAPHLFVYHWVDGVPTCYNTCGFVPTSQRVRAGMRVPSGGFGTFRIEHVADRWEITVDGTRVGYYPDSEWQGRFTRAGLVQAFGEVASNNPPPCDDMGTGKYADSAASSRVADFRLLDSTTPVALSYLVTSPEWYSLADATASSYRLGGPGAGRC